MKKTIIPTLLFLTLGISSCTTSSLAQKNNAITISKTDNLTPIKETKFTGEKISNIKISSIYEVTIIKGEQTSLQLSYPAPLKDRIITELSNGVLNLAMSNNTTIKGDAKLKAIITCPNFNSLNLGGAAECTIESSGFQAQNLSLNISGASELKSNYIITNNGDLRLNLSGASETFIRAINSTGSITATISGASDFEAELSASNDITLNASGSVDLKSNLKTNENIYITTSGASDFSGKISTKQDVKIKCSGSSETSLSSLICNNLTISADGASDVKANTHTNGEINTSSSGSAEINLTGSAKSISISATGASEVDIRGMNANITKLEKTKGASISK